ncbi:MAG: hypothetical protein GY842_21065 [bacterium]|nr:hypothetical protein [bacterium]
MYNRNQAEQQICDFLRSTDQVLLLTGTHQQEKHPLALRAVLSEYPAPATVLFRTNHASHYRDFLRPVLPLQKKPRPGVPIRVHGAYELFVDTMNRASWGSTPRAIDVAVLYPIDSYKADTGTESVQDVQFRGAKKTFLITWTDNRDIAWTNHFAPVHVVYDAEAERPDYHERVRELSKAPLADETLTRLPKYAQSIPHDHLIRVRCSRCRSTRWARMNMPYPGEAVLHSAKTGVYWARCLKCGMTADEHTKWYR